MTARGRTSFLLTVGITGSLLAWGGCSSAGDDSGEGIPIDRFAAAFADALCGNIGPCCQQEGYAYDAAACRAKTEGILGNEAAQTKAAGGPYDPKGARACVDVVASLAKSCSGDDTEAVYKAACNRVYAGDQPEGAK